MILYAGAKVIGAVTVASNSTVGANAVVVKNVLRNPIFVGILARIIAETVKEFTNFCEIEN